MLIQLRALETTDSRALAQLANNKKVWDNLRDYLPHPYDENDAKTFIAITKKESPKQNFAITYNGQLCGVIGVIIQKDVYRKSGELGYWLGEPFWGKGIAAKAVQQITEYGFAELGLNRIYASVFEFNKASMKVLEKNGFEREGVFKNAVIKNGKVCDEHRYFKLYNQ